MRISTAMQYQNHLNYLQTANGRVELASQRYNTGKLFQTAGENPAGMAASIKYESDIQAYEQYSTNANIVADTLSQEETALGQIWDALSSIQTRLIQAINGTIDDSSRAALAEDIKQTQAQIFDLMNTKNAEGDYIFSGANSSEPTYRLTSDGQYICQADGSNKYVMVSPTIKVQTTDSGLNIFENCQLAYNFGGDNANFTNADGTALSGADAGYLSAVDDYDQFKAFYEDNYNYDTGANNTFSITINGSEFTLKGPDGNTLDQGQIKDGRIVTQGMEFTLPSDFDYNATNEATGAVATGQINFTLQAPEQDNILNQLSNIIDDLLVPSNEYGEATDSDGNVMSNAQLTRNLARLQETIGIAKTQVDQYRGYVGARGANIDAIIKSNENLSLIKSEAKANVTEIDVFQAVSDLVLSNNALQVAQQSYNIVHSSTLFDYIS
ncbi:MAG: flagellar hook-associated protein FlgL [Candidatus Anaerobiospirillum pullicola]|uniref:Flagellar hook-associated protein FlgL n=1 Tax=Candidatus Anaerobiospirillum pullicola TaxID=2838451 RepID=A0A948WYK5_9GAMM|nr:flagellar hook-associated protein FlgL [Candidatus Anaerobiospirillum pullicola]